MPWRLSPSDSWVRALLPCALIFAAVCLDRNLQTDLWHHLARGRAIVQEGSLLNEDRFTYTVAGQPLLDVNWLWQVAFYKLYELGGLALAQVANAVVLTAMLALLLGLAARRSSVAAAGGVGVLVFLGVWQLLLIRPQTLSFFLFVLLLVVLEGSLKRPWLLVLPPLIMALWVNVHGGFPIGLVLVGCYVLAGGVAWGARRLGWPETLLEGADVPADSASLLPRLACLGASLVATLANPYGWKVYEYVMRTSARASSRRIDEWLPPGLDTLTGKVWVLSLILLVAALAWSRRRPLVREVCLLAVFLLFASRSVRMVAWWLFVLAPVLAAQLHALFPASRREEQRGLVPGLICAALAAVMLLSLPWLERVSPVMARPERRHRPEDDLEVVARHLSSAAKGGRIFTRLAWGEYLGWALTPRFTVFMDGRIEIIPDEVWEEYTAINRGREGWQKVLDRYDVDYLLLDETGYHHALLPLVEASPRWQLVFQQGPARLYVRAKE